MRKPSKDRAETRVWAAQTQGRVTLPGNDAAVIVPSGQAVTLQDVIVDAPSPDMAIYRFRYLAPAIARDGGTMSFEASIDDMQALCEGPALGQLTTALPASVQVIISLADMAMPFGDANPDATQFFMSFQIKDGECVLEPY